MTKKTEHKVGERFELCKLIYEVREGMSCEGCANYVKDENNCADLYKHEFEPCGDFEREDCKDVIFVQVGEAKD